MQEPPNDLENDRTPPPELPTRQADLTRLLAAQYADFSDDLPWWLRLAKAAGGPVLELGCGPGRLLHPLAAEGFQVAGLDVAPEMIAWAADHLNPAESAAVQLVIGDMRQFDLGRAFGLAIVACNTLAYFNDAEALDVLAAVRRHLRPGGALGLDLPSTPDLSPSPEAHGLVDTFFEPTTGHAVQVSAQTKAGPLSSSVAVTWHYDELLPDGRVARHTFPVTYHIRLPAALEPMLARSGFVEHTFYGDYDGRPWTPQASRLLVRARVP